MLDGSRTRTCINANVKVFEFQIAITRIPFICARENCESNFELEFTLSPRSSVG